MRNIFLINIIISVYVLLSCDQGKRNNETNYRSKKLITHKLIVKDTIEIELDSITSVSCRFSHHKVNGLSYLAMVNVDHHDNNIISIYNTETFKISKKIIINKRGPDEVGEITHKFTFIIGTLFLY